MKKTTFGTEEPPVIASIHAHRRFTAKVHISHADAHGRIELFPGDTFSGGLVPDRDLERWLEDGHAVPADPED